MTGIFRVRVPGAPSPNNNTKTTMNIDLEMTRKRLLQVSSYNAEPWNFTAIPEFAPSGGLDALLEYHQKILAFIEAMPESERQAFETTPDGCGCTGRQFLDSAEKKIERALKRRAEKSHE